MKQYENKGLGLAKFLLDFDYVIIDTCSLMDVSFPKWMKRLGEARGYLAGTKCCVCVPKECIAELQKLSRKAEEPERRDLAKNAIKWIRQAKRQKILSILKKQKKRSEGIFADNAIYIKVSADRLTQKILVITQDKKLASDLLALNSLMSQRGYPLRVYRLVGPNGDLLPNHGETNLSEKPKFKPSSSERKGTEAKTKPAEEKSAAPKQPTPPAVSPKTETQKEEPPKAEKPTPAPEAPVNKRFYSAPSLLEAIQGSAALEDLLFRYPSIPYQRQFHGRLDLTEDDLRDLVARCKERLNKETVFTITLRNLSVDVDTSKNDYKVYLSVIQQPKSKEAKSPSAPESLESIVSKAEEWLKSGEVAFVSQGHLQVRFSISFPRAVGVLESLIAKGLVGPNQTKNKGYPVLVAPKPAPSTPAPAKVTVAQAKQWIGSEKPEFLTLEAIVSKFGVGNEEAEALIQSLIQAKVLGAEKDAQKGYPVVPKKPKGPAPQVLSPELYQKIRSTVLEGTMEYVTFGYIQREFSLGFNRAGKVIGKLIEEQIIEKKATAPHGFRVLRSKEPEKGVKKAASVPLTEEAFAKIRKSFLEKDLEYVSVDYFVTEHHIDTPTATEVVSKLKSEGLIAAQPTKNKGFLVKKPVQKPLPEKKAEKKAPQPKPATKGKPSASASSKKTVKKPAPKTPKETPVAAEPRLIAPETVLEEAPKPAPKKSPAKTPEGATALSPALKAALKGEANLQSLLDQGNSSAEQINAAIAKQLQLYAALTPSEKRKVTLNKTALGKLMRK
ncbi:MAG: hypothetical protein SOV58_01660 [Candidatus Enteromonas sp.]|nr:hypothetical protein [Candidatus Enteromonas sp.]